MAFDLLKPQRKILCVETLTVSICTGEAGTQRGEWTQREIWGHSIKADVA